VHWNAAPVKNSVWWWVSFVRQLLKSKIFKAFDILLKYDQKLQYILIVSKNEN
jgi:hypothetical protein